MSKIAKVHFETEATIVLYKSGSFSLSIGSNAISFDGSEKAKEISVSGTSVTFNKPGRYEAHIEYRSTTDVWTKLYVLDGSNNVKGDGSWGGSGVNYPNAKAVMFDIDTAGVHRFILHVDGADGASSPGPTQSFSGNSNRTLQITVKKISDL